MDKKNAGGKWAIPRPPNRSGIKRRARQKDFPKLRIEFQKAGNSIQFNSTSIDWTMLCKSVGIQEWGTQETLSSPRFDHSWFWY